MITGKETDRMHKWLMSFVATTEKIPLPRFGHATFETEEKLPSMGQLQAVMDEGKKSDTLKDAFITIISVSEIAPDNYNGKETKA